MKTIPALIAIHADLKGPRTLSSCPPPLHPWCEGSSIPAGAHHLSPSKAQPRELGGGFCCGAEGLGSSVNQHSFLPTCSNAS